MVNSVISVELDREKFLNELLPSNEGLILIKFGAEWCKPCKLVKPIMNDAIKNWPEEIKCYDLDVDDNFDIYAFLKSKRMINGIPVILAYKKGNVEFAPNLSVTGANKNDLNNFFSNCINLFKAI